MIFVLIESANNTSKNFNFLKKSAMFMKMAVKKCPDFKLTVTFSTINREIYMKIHED